VAFISALQRNIFKLLWPRTQMASLFGGKCPQLQTIFGDMLSHVETWVFYNHISKYFSNISVPLIGWCPRQLPDWSKPFIQLQTNI